MPSHKLPPLDFKEENTSYDAHRESVEVKLSRCSHKNVKFLDGQLRCSCGAGWSGPRISEVYEKLAS